MGSPQKIGFLMDKNHLGTPISPVPRVAAFDQPKKSAPARRRSRPSTAAYLTPLAQNVFVSENCGLSKIVIVYINKKVQVSSEKDEQLSSCSPRSWSLRIGAPEHPNV